TNRRRRSSDSGSTLSCGNALAKSRSRTARRCWSSSSAGIYVSAARSCRKGPERWSRSLHRLHRLDQRPALLGVRRPGGRALALDGGQVAVALAQHVEVLALRPAADQLPALGLGSAAPDAVHFPPPQRLSQALLGDGATPADGLSLLDLKERRARRPDRGEQLRVLAAAGRAVGPAGGGLGVEPSRRAGRAAGRPPGA